MVKDGVVEDTVSGSSDEENEIKKGFLGMGAEHRKPSGMTWEKLNKIEKERLRILDKVELPFQRVLMSWNGTCLHAITFDVMIWVPILIYIAIRAFVHASPTGTIGESFAKQVESGASKIQILGGFLSFFLVLFVNQTNSRFFDMYALSRACSGRVQDIAGLAAAKLPSSIAHRMVRYMNAAHLAGYVGLGGPYTKENFFDHFNELHGLLQPDELAKFDKHNVTGLYAWAGAHRENNVFKELCTWVQKEVATAQKEGIIDSIEATDMHTRILNLRAHMDGIHDTCFQPPHFFYIHFLCLLSALYLPLFAIDMSATLGWDSANSNILTELVAAIIVLLQSIFVVGLRLLGQRMIDPYGDDYEDIAVITIVSGCVEITRIILDTHDQDSVDKKLEANLHHLHNEHTVEEKF
mmetsp:Transcript_2869/g.6752  ORF Transcript_2869/g.6752 Transcript_2869/m.6752 type:complete len:409 (+) Transcript_2869:43-1269(+)